MVKSFPAQQVARGTFAAGLSHTRLCCDSPRAHTVVVLLHTLSHNGFWLPHTMGQYNYVYILGAYTYKTA